MSPPYLDMTDTGPKVLHQPVWVSALLASAGTAAVNALRHAIHWESGRAALRFVNEGQAPVFIPALGVELRAGGKLDVRWPAGATSYECQFVRAA